MKKYLAFFILILPCMISTFQVQSKEIHFWLDSTQVHIFDQYGKSVSTLDSPPVVEEGRSLLPIRYVSEMIGAKVTWDDRKKEATVATSGTHMILSAETKEALVNSKPYALDVPPKIIRGRLYLPLRFVSESLNLSIEWISAEKKIIVSTHSSLDSSSTLMDHSPETSMPLEPHHVDDEDALAKVSSIEETINRFSLEDDHQTEFKVYHYRQFIEKIQTATRMGKKNLTLHVYFKDSRLSIDKTYHDLLVSINENYQYPLHRYVRLEKILRTETQSEHSVFELSFDYPPLPFDALNNTTIYPIKNKTDLTEFLSYAKSKKLLHFAFYYPKPQENLFSEPKYLIENLNSKSNLEQGHIITYQNHELFKLDNHQFILFRLTYEPVDMDYPSILSVNERSTLIQRLTSEIDKKSNSVTVFLENYDEQHKDYDLFSINEDLLKVYPNARVRYEFIEPITNELTFVKFHFEYNPKDGASLNNEKSIYKKLESSISNMMHSSSIDQSIDLTIFNQISTNVSNHNLESTINSWTLYSNGNIKFKYYLTQKQIQQANEFARQVVKELIRDDMTDTEKAKVLHDYLVQNASYTEGDLTTLPHENFSHYGILLKKKGVCQGYATAFNTLAKMSGIKTFIVTGVAGKSNQPHAWNIVEIDGIIYHIDVTFDDPTGNHFFQGIQNSYFMLMDKYIAKDHQWDTFDNSRRYFDIENESLF
jgi:hypothetical protein